MQMPVDTGARLCVSGDVLTITGGDGTVIEAHIPGLAPRLHQELQRDAISSEVLELTGIYDTLCGIEGAVQVLVVVNPSPSIIGTARGQYLCLVGRLRRELEAMLAHHAFCTRGAGRR